MPFLLRQRCRGVTYVRSQDEGTNYFGCRRAYTIPTGQRRRSTSQKEPPMSRYRRLLSTLGVIVMLLLTVGAAAAKPNDKPKPPHGWAGHLPAGAGKPAHLTWTPRRITQAVTAGQTIQVTATFSSSADIAEATLVIPG